MKFQTYSYRFAEQVLNSKLKLKHEIEDTIKKLNPDLKELSRPKFNEIVEEKFSTLGWQSQPSVFGSEHEAYAKMDFLKKRVGVEVEFGRSLFLGIDLLKFQNEEERKLKIKKKKERIITTLSQIILLLLMLMMV